MNCNGFQLDTATAVLHSPIKLNLCMEKWNRSRLSASIYKKYMYIFLYNENSLAFLLHQITTYVPKACQTGMQHVVWGKKGTNFPPPINFWEHCRKRLYIFYPDADAERCFFSLFTKQIKGMVQPDKNDLKGVALNRSWLLQWCVQPGRRPL